MSTFMKVSTIAVATTALVFWLYSPPAHAQTNGMERAKTAREQVEPSLTTDLKAKGLRFGTPVFLRILKEERALELWMQEPEKRSFKLFRTYRIAAMSGKLGPKLKEGDRQAPEGFYFVNRARLKPDSVFHLAMNIGYPNIYDRAHGRGGSFLMIHGNRVSIGCFAMTDAKIEEIYTLCDAALQKGQPFFRVHCFPFHMNDERMTEAHGDRWEPFWKNLKEGYDAFENGKIPPNVEVEKKRYVFPR
jgi:murein L,D-transpeptidase YafK